MSKKIFIIIVALIFILPSVFDLITVADETNENRKLKSRPVFSFDRITNSNNVLKSAYKEIIDFKNNYDDYYSSNFALKRQLFVPYYFIQKDVFNQNPLPAKVVNGKNGWMFLGDSYSNVILESRGLVKFNEEELDVISENEMSISSFLKSNDVAYYLAIAPNKHTIYGNQLFSFNYTGTTKKTQVQDALSFNNLDLIDLGNGFDEMQEQLFFKTNTHWNDLGAFNGYLNLMEAVKSDFKNLNPVSLNDIEVEEKISWKEDLTNMLDIRVKEVSQSFKIITPKSRRVKAALTVPEHFKRASEDYEHRYESSCNNLKVIIFRDSFSSAMEKYLAESFGETIFIWSSDIDNELILKEKPDIVINEIIERDIDVLLKGN